MKLLDLVSGLKKNEGDKIVGRYTPQGLAIINETTHEYVIYNEY